MTTGWLLLLLLVVSSQSVDNQSTTDDETCREAGLLSKQQTDIEKILDNQRQLFQMLRQLQQTKSCEKSMNCTGKCPSRSVKSREGGAFEWRLSGDELE